MRYERLVEVRRSAAPERVQAIEAREAAAAVAFETVAWFNGGLFDDADALIVSAVRS